MTDRPIFTGANLYYVKLNEDMISYKGEIVKVPLTEESFGKREDDPQRSTLYEEGPWLYKRNDLYYLFWPGGPLPEHIGYSTVIARGPWKYGRGDAGSGKGIYQPSGVIDFRGKPTSSITTVPYREVADLPALWPWKNSNSIPMDPSRN